MKAARSTSVLFHITFPDASFPTPTPRSWPQSVLKVEPVLALTMVPFCVQEKPPVAETALAVVVTVVGGVETVTVGASADEDVCHKLHESCGKGGKLKAPSFPHFAKTSRRPMRYHVNLRHDCSFLPSLPPITSKSGHRPLWAI